MELKKRLKINNELGLHARAAAKIVEVASQYKSKLYLRKGEQEADGCSILSILTLACPKGTEIEARVVGEDSEAMMEALGDLINRNFDEVQ